MSTKRTSKAGRKRQAIREAHQSSMQASLAEMTKMTADGVQDAIDNAQIFYPSQVYRHQPRGPLMHKQALFDGILDVLSDTIIEHADMGSHEMLTENVCDRLEMLVEMKTSAGKC